MNATKKQIRLSEKKIRAILELQEKSSGTVVGFCKAHKIQKATFYNWRNKYANKTRSGQSFIPLHLSEPVREEQLFAEIQLAAKVTVKLYQKVEASYFKALVS